MAINPPDDRSATDKLALGPRWWAALAFCVTFVAVASNSVGSGDMVLAHGALRALPESWQETVMTDPWSRFLYFIGVFLVTALVFWHIALLGVLRPLVRRLRLDIRHALRILDYVYHTLTLIGVLFAMWQVFILKDRALSDTGSAATSTQAAALSREFDALTTRCATDETTLCVALHGLLPDQQRSGLGLARNCEETAMAPGTPDAAFCGTLAAYKSALMEAQFIRNHDAYEGFTPEQQFKWYFVVVFLVSLRISLTSLEFIESRNPSARAEPVPNRPS